MFKRFSSKDATRQMMMWHALLGWNDTTNFLCLVVIVPDWFWVEGRLWDFYFSTISLFSFSAVDGMMWGSTDSLYFLIYDMDITSKKYISLTWLFQVYFQFQSTRDFLLLLIFDNDAITIIISNYHRLLHFQNVRKVVYCETGTENRSDFVSSLSLL